MGREFEQTEEDRAALREYFAEEMAALAAAAAPRATVSLRRVELAPTFIRELPVPSTSSAPRAVLTVNHLGASADGSAASIRLSEGREASTGATRAALYRLAAVLEENVPAGMAVLVDTRKGALRLEPADISVAELIEAEDHLRRAAELLGLAGEGV